MWFPRSGNAFVRARTPIAILLSSVACGSVACALASSPAWAGFGVSKWEAGTCKESSCNVQGKDPGAEFFTQAAGHPNFGITDFAFRSKKGITAEEPEGNVKDVRVDLPPGLAVNPEAVEACPEAVIEKFGCPQKSQVGEEEAIGTAELTLGVKTTVTENFPVYVVERKPGEPARFGVEVTSSTLRLGEMATGHKLQSVIYLDGGISWHSEAATSENSGVTSGDYHEFFQIQNIAREPEIVESKLIFWGVPHEHNPAAPENAFLTMPSSANACSQPQTTWLHVDSYEHPGDFLAYATETRLENGTPLTATGCGTLEFNPSLALKAETNQSDEPDGATVDLHVPQTTSEPTKVNSPDVLDTEVALPEGMTLNPSAANGLEACTNAQIRLGTNGPIGCPAGSKIGTVTVDAPGIPPGTLAGSVYLATQQSQEPESGKEYRIFLVAEAPLYGVGLRLEGAVRANKTTGQLTTVFADDPQVPFEDIVVKFNGGPRAPLANPLKCGAARPAAALTPYSGQPPTSAATTGFTVGTGTSAPCPAQLPFTLAQSTHDQSATAGAYTSFTFDLARGDGQQRLARVSTVLPPGLLGAIPTVGLCAEAAANAGSCPAGSEIGQASVTVGSGPEPYGLAGHVYLTGPYGGAPYGLAIAVPAVAGPFNLGTVITRASVGVETYTGRVVVTSPVPTIVGGVPLRLRTLSVVVDRPDFLFNPTNCSPLATNSVLSSLAGATQGLATPFQVGDCGKLPFKPTFAATTGAKTSKLKGASIEVKITQGAHQANIREVQVQLPKKLPSRLSTLQKACPASVFEVAVPPGSCPSTSRVGSATVTTPVLPGVLTGPAYVVSHGGEAFPDLDLILRGDGVEVVLVGHTHISTKGITTSTFETLPDVPISSAVVSLPVGPQSILTANGNLCRATLKAPTTIVAQSGAKIAKQTTIAVRNCPVTIISHRVVHNKVLVRVKTFAAGRLTVGGRGLHTRRRRLRKARTLTVKVPLSRAGAARLDRHRHLRIKLRVSFKPRSGHGSKASATVTFRVRR
jgi:hypothetical protein